MVIVEQHKQAKLKNSETPPENCEKPSRLEETCKTTEH